MEVIPIMEICFAPRFSSRRKGVVQTINDDKAEVLFEIPNTPKVCGSCGFAGSLSVNRGTGEVECLRRGCGHGQGFRKVTTTIALNLLESWTTYTAKKQKAEWEEQLKSKQSAVTDLEKHLEVGRKNGWIN
jgi:hypothetical protein